MPLSALCTVLAAAVMHAVWNLAAKAKRGDSYVFVWWYSVASMVVTVPLGALVVLRELREDAAVSPALWWAPAVSAALHVGYNLCLQTGYDRAPLSVVYPTARGTGPVLTMIVAVACLGERPGWLALAGALLIVCGIVVTAAGRRPEPRLGAASGAARSRHLAGLGWGAATGAFIAGYTLWDDHSVAALTLAPIPYFALSTVFQTAFMTSRLNRRRRAVLVETLRRNWRPILAIAVLSPAAYVLVLVVMQTQPVSLVAPLRESSIVIGALLAWLIFKEPGPGRKLVGCAVVLTGIAVMA